VKEQLEILSSFDCHKQTLVLIHSFPVSAFSSNETRRKSTAALLQQIYEAKHV